MKMISVTIGSAATRVVPLDPIVQHPEPWQSVTFYNPNASNAVYIGDSQVTTSNGLKLAAGAYATFTAHYAEVQDLKDWWVAGTAADKVTVIVVQ